MQICELHEGFILIIFRCFRAFVVIRLAEAADFLAADLTARLLFQSSKDY
jgi:hypothetical protein